MQSSPLVYVFLALIATGVLAGLAFRRRLERYWFDLRSAVFFKRMAGMIDTPCVLLDRDGRVERMTGEPFRELGVSPVPPLDSPFADMLPDAVAPLYLYHMQDAAAGKYVVFYTGTTSDAGGRFVLVTILPMGLPRIGIAAYFLTVRDMTPAVAPYLDGLFGNQGKADGEYIKRIGELEIALAKAEAHNAVMSAELVRIKAESHQRG